MYFVRETYPPAPFDDAGMNWGFPGALGLINAYHQKFSAVVTTLSLGYLIGTDIVVILLVHPATVAVVSWDC